MRGAVGTRGERGVFGVSDSIGMRGAVGVFRRAKTIQYAHDRKDTFCDVRSPIATPLGLLAEGSAWGEWGVEEIASVVSGETELGYTPAGMESGWSLEVMFPDYTMAPLPEWCAYILSAVIGVAVLVIAFRLLSALAKPASPFDKDAEKA